MTPFRLLLLAVLGSIIALQTARHEVYKSAADKPLDWAGDGLKCSDCGGVLGWSAGHEYRCKNCNRKCLIYSHGSSLVIVEK